MEDLLSEIETFCGTHDIAESTFGRMSVKDTSLLKQLREGRELRRATVEKVRRFMVTYVPAEKAKAA